MCSGNLSIPFEKEFEQAIRLDGRPQAPQNLLVRLLVGHIVVEKNENPLAQTLLVHLAVELSSVYGLTVEADELVRAHIGLREIDPAGTELADPVIVAELNVEPLGEFGQKRIFDACGRELNWKGADFRPFLVLDDGAAAEIRKELMTPTGAENGALFIDQTLNDLAQRWAEGMFPGDRKRTGSADQDGVSVFDVAPTDIRVFDEVDEVELAPRDTAALDKAALLLFEGYELVPDLEEDESKSGSWCGHFILRALFAGGL